MRKIDNQGITTREVYLLPFKVGIYFTLCMEIQRGYGLLLFEVSEYESVVRVPLINLMVMLFRERGIVVDLSVTMISDVCSWQYQKCS